MRPTPSLPNPPPIVRSTPTIGKVISTDLALPGEEVGISLEITTSSPVTIIWEVDPQGGEILDGQGTPVITYRAPTTPGTYQVRVRVEYSDAHIERNVSIRVVSPPTDTPIVTTVLTATLTTPMPTEVPTRQLGFTYLVRVQVKDEDEYVQDAEVTIEVTGQAPLDGITDSKGIARIFVDPAQAGQPGFMIVEATGYKKYTQHIDLFLEALPDVVLLEPLVTPAVEVTVTTPPTTTSPSPWDTYTTTPEAVVVSANGLCLRDGPGTNYNVIGYLKNGEILDIRGCNAGRNWIKVVSASSSKEGWVSAAPEYVKINVDSNSIPVVETPTPPTPVQFPDAVVIAPGGVVPLRSAPGDNYDLVCSLPDGTRLDVLRRVHNKDGWIKVAVNPESDERMEGYVTTVAGLVKVNVNLDDVPPIYEFGPELFEPKPSVQRALEEPITFKWQDYGVLEEQQYYSLIIYRSDLSEKDACYHDQHKVPEVLIKPEDYDGCTPGVYYWGVGIATKILGEDGKPMLGEDGRLIWRDDSERDHRRVIGLGVPPPESHAGDTHDSGELPFIP